MIFFTILALALPSLFYGIYIHFKRLRTIFASVPSLKRSFLFGNIFEIGNYLKPDRHPGMSWANLCPLVSTLLQNYPFGHVHFT
jgi:hypothetical protein